MSQVELSFIIPAYNEGLFIENTLGALDHIIADKKLPYEILVVDDGSRDNTLTVVRRYAGKNGHVRILTYNENVGKGHAIRTGFMKAHGNVIFFTDGDMEIDLTDISSYLDALKHSDIVIASKRHTNSHVTVPFSRRLLSEAFNSLVRFLTGIHLKDTQSGLKAMKKSAFIDIFPKLAVKRYAFDVELLVVASLYGLKIVEMPVNIKLAAKFKPLEMLNMFVDLLGITYRLKILHWYCRPISKNSLKGHF